MLVVLGSWGSALAQDDVCHLAYAGFVESSPASVPDSAGQFPISFGPGGMTELSVADTLDEVIPPLAPPGGWYVALSNPQDSGLYWGRADGRLTDPAPGTSALFEIRIYPRYAETAVDSILLSWSSPCFSPPGVTTLKMTSCDSGAVLVPDMSTVPSFGVTRGGELWDDDSMCFVIRTTDALVAHAKLFLEGPYTSGKMTVPPLFRGSVPLDQPYSDAVFDGTPLDFDSTQSIASLPDSTIDWVLVSLRVDETPGTVLASSRHAAILLSDGVIVEADASPLQFSGVAPGGYRLVARHRNHIAVLSADTLDLSDGIGSWDFTTDPSKAQTGGAAPMAMIDSGVYALFAGEGATDGVISAPDFNLWLEETTAGQSGYRLPDYDLDGNVTVSDFNFWSANTTAGAASQVPE